MGSDVSKYLVPATILTALFCKIFNLSKHVLDISPKTVLEFYCRFKKVDMLSKI